MPDVFGDGLRAAVDLGTQMIVRILATRQKITNAILIAESTKISVMQSCRTPMRHLFGTSSAVPEKILSQAQDDEVGPEIFVV